jgi:Putative beta-barrel porin 2
MPSGFASLNHAPALMRLFLLVLVLTSNSFLNAQSTVYLPSPANLPLFRPSADLDWGVYRDLPFQVSAFAAIAYDDNAFAQHSDRIGSGFTEAALNVGSHIGNERTKLDANLGFGVDLYWERPGRTADPNFGFNVSFSHRLTPRASVTFTKYSSLASEPNLQLGVTVINTVTTYLYTTNVLALTYSWTPRLSTVTSYTGNVIVYENSSVGNPLNRLENIFGQQFRFLLLPAIAVVGEYRFEYIDYFSNPSQTSYTNLVLGGADMTLTPRLTFNIRAGEEFRSYEQSQPGRPDELAYPFTESNLVYQYQPRSYLEWYNSYGIEESDMGTGYRRTYRTGLKISHLAGRLRIVGAAYYSYNEYVAPSFTENVLDLNLGAIYHISRAFALTAGYTFERDFSQEIARDYYRNRVYLGLSLAF